MIKNERQSYLTRVLPDGRVLDVFELIGRRARIVLSDDLASVTWTDGW